MSVRIVGFGFFYLSLAHWASQTNPKWACRVQIPNPSKLFLGPKPKTLKPRRKTLIVSLREEEEKNGGHSDRRGRDKQRYRGSSGSHRGSPDPEIRRRRSWVGPPRLRSPVC